MSYKIIYVNEQPQKTKDRFSRMNSIRNICSLSTFEKCNLIIGNLLLKVSSALKG